MIAILGATGYIGGSLARQIARSSAGQLSLFAREPSRLAEGTWPSSVRIRPLCEFAAADFDLIVNAIGAGDPARVRQLGVSLLAVTDLWDRQVLKAMKGRTRYVFLSSGVVRDVDGAAAPANSEADLLIDRFRSLPPYTLAKLRAEARHRQAGDRDILDIRVFSYADEGIARGGTSFLAELARSVAEKTPFRTSPADMTRDYAGAEELWSLIRCWTNAGAPNLAADLYSAAPVGKWALLEAARARYGLTVEIVAPGLASPTGDKPSYASRHRLAKRFGYVPRRTSLDIALSVLDRLAAVEGRPVLATSP